MCFLLSISTVYICSTLLFPALNRFLSSLVIVHTSGANFGELHVNLVNLPSFPLWLVMSLNFLPVPTTTRGLKIKHILKKYKHLKCDSFSFISQNAESAKYSVIEKFMLKCVTWVGLRWKVVGEMTVWLSSSVVVFARSAKGPGFETPVKLQLFTCYIWLLTETFN